MVDYMTVNNTTEEYSIRTEYAKLTAVRNRLNDNRLLRDMWWSHRCITAPSKIKEGNFANIIPIVPNEAMNILTRGFPSSPPLASINIVS